MVDQDKIIRYVAMKGLVLPIQLSSELKQSTIITGAILSELVSEKKLKISDTKVGGSPVYYIKEQKHRLQELYKYLNEKDKRAYDLLKQKKVLRDAELTPLLRVSLRKIKDFAKPVEVNLRSGRELFWRWYLVPTEEVEAIIRSFFETPKPGQGPEPKQKPAAGREPARPQQPTPEKKESTEKQGQPTLQQKLTKDEPIKDTLHEKTKRFFNNKNIIIKSIDIIRKNSEIDYILEVPSSVGNIAYYCKAKSKKRCNDSDLASAFVQGQMKKLPVLFISTGNLTKRAKDMLGTEFRNLKVKMLKGG